MRTFVVILLVVGGIFLVGVAWTVSAYNGLIRGSQGVDGQWAQVQNAYQRRADLVPNLVNTVSGAANFEKSTLMEITEARASVGKVQINSSSAPNDPAVLEQFEKAQGQLSSALSRLLVVVERYPDLKATTNFRDLQAQLEGTENRIAVERGRFNDEVRSYNTRVQSFPGNLVAGRFGFAVKPYFAAAPTAATPPDVRFNFGPSTQPARP